MHWRHKNSLSIKSVQKCHYNQTKRRICIQNCFHSWVFCQELSRLCFIKMWVFRRIFFWHSTHHIQKSMMAVSFIWWLLCSYFLFNFQTYRRKRMKIFKIKIIKLKIKKVMFWISSNSNITLTHNLHAFQWLGTNRLFSAGTPFPPIKLTATIYLIYCWKWR